MAATTPIKIEMTVTVAMTEQQMREWAEDNDVDLAAVPGNVRSYILHNLLVVSRAREDYWTDVDVRP